IESYPDGMVSDKPGVVEQDIHKSGIWTADYYAILRLLPNAAPPGKAAAALQVAHQQIGKPYNGPTSGHFFDKNWTGSFYCSQLVWYAYMQAPNPVDL